MNQSVLCHKIIIIHLVIIRIKPAVLKTNSKIPVEQEEKDCEHSVYNDSSVFSNSTNVFDMNSVAKIQFDFRYFMCVSTEL